MVGYYYIVVWLRPLRHYIIIIDGYWSLHYHWYYAGTYYYYVIVMRYGYAITHIIAIIILHLLLSHTHYYYCFTSHYYLLLIHLSLFSHYHICFSLLLLFSLFSLLRTCYIRYYFHIIAYYADDYGYFTLMFHYVHLLLSYYAITTDSPFTTPLLRLIAATFVIIHYVPLSRLYTCHYYAYYHYAIITRVTFITIAATSLSLRPFHYIVWLQSSSLPRLLASFH